MDAILGEMSARSLGITMADHVYEQRRPSGRYKSRRRGQRRPAPAPATPPAPRVPQGGPRPDLPLL